MNELKKPEKVQNLINKFCVTIRHDPNCIQRSFDLRTTNSCNW